MSVGDREGGRKTPSESASLIFFKKECDKADDDLYSCLLVARMYELGEGIPKDPGRAAVYYGKVAKILSPDCARGESGACEQLKGLPLPLAAQSPGPPAKDARNASTPVSLLSGTAFLEVVAAFRERLGSPLRITELDLTPSWAYLKVEDPKQPGKGDEYQWKDGRLRDPRPVDLSGVKLKDALFALDDVDLGAIPALLEEALKRVNAPGAKVTRVLADRDFSKEVQIRVMIDPGPGSGGRAVYVSGFEER